MITQVLEKSKLNVPFYGTEKIQQNNHKN